MSEVWIVPPLKTKDASVNLAVVPAFSLAATVLKTAYAMYGAQCVVTSGKDGKHSAKSAHYQGKAMDLRISNLPPSLDRMEFAFRLSLALVECCGPEWYVVLEKDHLHIEFAKGIPNIKGWKAGKHFYAQEGV